MYRSYEQAGYVDKNRKVIQGKLSWVSALIGNVGFGGGLYIDIDGRTTLEGLYAAGDASYGPTSGVEGFCAYAMPAASTTGAAVGEASAKYAATVKHFDIDDAEVERLTQKLTEPLRHPQGVDPAHVVIAVQEALSPMTSIFSVRKKRCSPH